MFWVPTTAYDEVSLNKVNATPRDTSTRLLIWSQLGLKICCFRKHGQK